MKKNNTKYSLKRIVIYAFISFFICLLVFELSLRGYGLIVHDNKIPFTYDSCLESKKYLPNVSVMIKNEYGVYENNINMYGFRDDNPYYNENISNVFFLGDSTTYGMGVPHNDTFVNIYAKRLNKSDVRVYNFGSPDFYQRIELNSYNCYVKEFKPKVIYLVYSEYSDFNDLHDSIYKQNDLISVNNSLFSTIRYSITKNIIVINYFYFNALVPIIRNLHFVDEGYYDRKLSFDEYNVTFEKTKYYFSNFKNISNVDNFTFVVIYYPFPEVAYNNSFNPDLNYRQLKYDIFDFFKNDNISYIDLTRIFNNNDTFHDIIFDDVHLTKLGHKYVSDVICNDTNITLYNHNILNTNASISKKYSYNLVCLS